MPPADTDKKEKRRKEIKWWFDEFANNALAQSGLNIIYDDNAEEKINNEYWDIVENQIRPQLEGGVEATIDRHKIISTTEILIAIRCPIKNGETLYEQKHYNANLAHYVAMNIFLNFCKVECIPERASDAMISFGKAHLTWLHKAGVEGKPYFSNAATWFLLEELCLIASEKDISAEKLECANVIED